MRGPNPSPITMPSMSRALSARAALSTLSAPTRPTRSPTATASCRIGAAAAGDQHGRLVQAGRIVGSAGTTSPREASVSMRRKTVPCSARMRDAAPSRCTIRAGGSARQKSPARPGSEPRNILAHARDDRREDADCRRRADRRVRGQIHRRARDRRTARRAPRLRVRPKPWRRLHPANSSRRSERRPPHVKLRRYPAPDYRQQRQTDLAAPWQGRTFQMQAARCQSAVNGPSIRPQTNGPTVRPSSRRAAAQLRPATASATFYSLRSRKAATTSGLTPTVSSAAWIVSRSAALPINRWPMIGSGNAASVAAPSMRPTIS